MQEKKTNFEIQVKINFAAGIQLFFPPCTRRVERQTFFPLDVGQPRYSLSSISL